VISPSADQLRPKSGKTMQATSAAGHSNFLHAGSKSDRLAGKKIAAQVCLICGVKATCGKEAFLLKAFLVTFVATNGVALLSTNKKTKPTAKN
jgi:hypothetical protein